MPTFFGNCKDIINWEEVNASLEGHEGWYDISRPDDPITEEQLLAKTKSSLDDYFLTNPENKTQEYLTHIRTEADTVMGNWLSAGYKYKNIFWENFRTGNELSESLATEFAKIVNAVPLRVFITRIVPGVTAPWHYDVLPDYSEYGEVVRYICFIHKAIPGQIIAFKDVTFYNEDIGNIYKWDDTKQWHAAANASLQPYSLFHFEGYKRNED